MQIYVAGSLAYDRIMTFPGKFSDHILPDKIHILNVCFMVDKLEEKFGGTAGNIAYTLALLGEDPLILATSGQDFDRYEAWLRKNRLRLDGVRAIPEEFTAGAYITTDKSDNQITGFNPGAMKQPSLFDFTAVEPASSLVIISPGNLDDMKTYARVCRERGIRFIFDPGQAIPAFSGAELLGMIQGAEILICNDYELEMIMKATGRRRAGLLELCRSIVVTMGEKGSKIVGQAAGERGEIRVGAAKAKEAADPTGAGDAYRAGMLSGLADGLSLPEACKLGAVSAVYAVEKYGTQEHSFTVEEFEQRYAENFG